MDVLATVFAQSAEEVAGQLGLDSLILTEFYFYVSIPLMWLIHAGFLMYEGGASRRKNVMATVLKNFLTIAVVTPTFYYFGWWIYGCFQNGGYSGASGPDNFPDFCGATYPWSPGSGGNLGDHLLGVFLVAFIVFSWVTGSIMSGAVIERIRLSSYLVLTVCLGSIAWVFAASWGWSVGWLTENYGYHDAAASMVVHGVAGFFALGVVMNLGPRIGKYDSEGRAREFRGHNIHLTLIGLMLIYAGFYGFYMACITPLSTTFPGYVTIYFTPVTLSAFCLTLTFGFAAGFVGGYFASKADPYWTMAGALAGAVTVSCGADIYHPSFTWLLALTGSMVTVWVGNWIEKKMRVDDAVGAFAVHGFAGLFGILMLGVFAGGYPTGVANVPTSFGGQLMGAMTMIPLGFGLGYGVSWVLKKLNLLRVSPEVELEGIDVAEYGSDFFPESAPSPEPIVLPTGEQVPSEALLREEYAKMNGGGRAPVRA